MKNISIRNKKASFNYELIERIVAGIVLTGTEIKSIRNGNANLNEAFCIIYQDELYVRGLHISPYEFGTHVNHLAKTDRKLLIKRKELDKWETKMKEKGCAIIPVKLFINDRGLAKVEIALGKGKKTHDKREALKQADDKREMSRVKAGKY